MSRLSEGIIEFQQKLIFFCLENAGLERKNLFEGDMILTDAQRMAAMFGEDVSKAGLGRAHQFARIYGLELFLYISWIQP